MYLWESDIQESVVFKPVEIRGKRGRKKLKKSNAAIYIPNMDADNFEKICNENGLKFVYVEVPPHGRLGDLDALAEKAIMRSEKRGVSVNVLDKVITAYDIKTAPTVIPAEEGET